MRSKTISVSLLAAVSIAVALSSAALGQVTYDVDGTPFDEVSGTVALGERITGAFTLPARPAPSSTTDVAGALLDYAFDGPLQSYTPANSEVIRFELTTDSLGQITQWSITIYSEPRTNTPGELFNGMDLRLSVGTGAPGCTPSPPSLDCTESTLNEQGGEITCSASGGNGCIGGSFVPGNNWGSVTELAFGAQSLGSTRISQETIDVPTLSIGLLVALGLVLGAVGLVVLSVAGRS